MEYFRFVPPTIIASLVVVTAMPAPQNPSFILDHMQAANAEFMKMGLKGISILTASGDDGTGKQGMFRCSHFDTNWPASSPYLTTVGGTYYSSGSEIGWSDSGGG